MKSAPKSTTRKVDVSKPRLVAALLAELDAAGALILAESQSTEAVFQSSIQCDFKVPFGNSVIGFDVGSDASEVLQCVCCFGGQRIAFELKRLTQNQWRLPKNVAIIEMRIESRMAFASRMYSAEIVVARGVVYGHAVDINHDYVAIDVDAPHDLSEGEPVRVIVRMVNTSVDVFYNRCVVAQVKDSKRDSQRIVLRLEKAISSVAGRRRHSRQVVESATVRVSGSAFEDGVGEATLMVQNISSGGMTVSLRKVQGSLPSIAGVVLKASEPDLSFLVVWADGNLMGLRPLLADPKHLGRWYQYLEYISPPDGHKSSVTRKELAALLTQSGLLKGSRRKHFGQDLGSHLVAATMADSLLLNQRRIVTDDSGKPVLHINLKRYSESAWLFADGAAFSEEKGAFNQMVHDCIVSTRSMMGSGGQLPRYLTFIWQDAVKSSAEYALKLAQQSDSLILAAAQLSIRSMLGVPSHDFQATDCTVSVLSTHSAAKRRALSLQYLPSVYEAFVGADGLHPILNAELGKFGPYHRAVTKVVEVTDGCVVLAHRIFTHNVWSTTGVSNSVFVVVPEGTPATSLRKSLAAIAIDEIAFGTDDFLLVFGGAMSTTADYREAFPTLKNFSFLVHDLLLNQALLFRDPGARID